MAISLDQFVQSLVSNGLMSEAELADYQGTFPPEKRPKDAEALAFELVRDKRLTKYQVTAILEGSPTGLVLGEYVLQSKIGEGGMGQVFRAIHRRLERSAAIKVLRAKSLDSPDAVKRFYQEVRVAARLNHQNIVTTYDASEQDGIHYLAMEYVAGLDLAALVKRDGPMPVVQALDYVIQAAGGLQYAHGKGVVHRDIKPSNLLLDTEGTVKILDMGLARITESDDASVGATLAERLTRTCQMLGTVDYMSPEQATDTRSADHRSDIYSLGCTLYRLLTGRPVYAGESAVMKLMAHCEGAIPSLADSPTEVPRDLDAVFSRMMAKKPDDRYQSMAEVIADLEACLEACQSIVRQMPNVSSIDRDSSVLPSHDEQTAMWDDATHGTESTEQTALPVAESTVEQPTTSGFAANDEPATMDNAPATLTNDKPATATLDKFAATHGKPGFLVSLVGFADQNKKLLLAAGIGALGALLLVLLLLKLLG